MEFKLVTIEEIDYVMEIIKDAKALLKKTSTQWQSAYPTRDVLINDINHKYLYGAYLDNILVGICAVIKGIDKNYLVIEGKWEVAPNEEDIVIHRIASKKEYYHHGVGSFLITEVKKMVKCSCPSIKIDTHELNLTMQHLVNKASFKYAGVVYLQNGEPDNKRLAYEFVF